MRDARGAARTGTTSLRQGFTLIEVLVAFIILALATLVIQRGVMTSVASAQRADGRLRAEMVARSLMTAPLKDSAAALAPESGVMDGLSWTLHFETVALPFATATDAQGKPPGWVPVRMVVTVALPEGQSLSPAGEIRIETVRLIKASPP
ncbi:hypothetical protein BTR14_09885 [Rhizobium rhizosphaerae]|uniref:General secretion pathway protein I n=1 Tax=Xaviernesmea rhizosphaerae TaxID=1672749 RepID=A0ABX3PF85_9HYPH|nr:type II secretion system protein [Xaviernesmea rhizosphaerae]OQP86738.1 hypothetical protein BTR14_09885 [Xaviernesmea rhizosphaerae]